MRHRLIAGLGFLLLFTGMSLASVPYPNYTQVSNTQTGGPFVTGLGGGLNNWDTPLKATNTGSQSEKIWFAWTEAWTRDSDGNLHVMTWDNALQQFEYTNLAGALETASQANAAFGLSLDPSSTDIPIPSAFGVSTSDTVPAFFVGNLAAGASGNWDVNQKLTTNIFEFYFNGSFVAQPTPEPASLMLLGSGLVGLIGLRRRK